MSGLGQLASVEQFHEQGHGAAYGALARLPFADRSQIIDAQPFGEGGLREARAKADGFEGRWCHLMRPLESRKHFSCAPSRNAPSDIRKSRRAAGSFSSSITSASSCMSPRSRLSDRRATANQCGPLEPGLDDTAALQLSVCNLLAEIVDVVANQAGNDLLQGLDRSVADFSAAHVHSPVSGGARPRVDALHIGPTGLSVNRRNAANAIIFGGHA